MVKTTIDRSRVRRVFASVLLIAAGMATQNALAQRYSVTVLPLPEGHWGAQCYSINIHGDMCGAAFSMERPYIPVLWRDNRVIKLPLLPHPRSEDGWAWRMNDLGVIVGRVDGEYPQQAVMWLDENTIVPILDRDSSGKDINNSMIVAGEYAVGFLDVRGFIWKDGDWQSLDPIQFINQLNERNQIVGGTNSRSWLWENGRFTEPVPLHPGARAQYSGINDLGVMVGWSHKEVQERHPVIWTDGVPREMPITRGKQNGVLFKMNNLGEAIGTSYSNPNQTYPTLWRHNLATEIADLALGPYSCEREITIDIINDNGQIAATIQYRDEVGYHVARLDPIDTGLTLWGMEPSRPGRRNVVQVNHATPGGRVSLLWGTERGEPAPMNHCNGAMIDIVDPRLAAIAVAGADGRAIFNVFIPANVLGLYVLQAVDHHSCEVSPPAWALLKTEN